ncbi:hypothetical protein K443DRAFT_3526 [Laccaria amethystina LaAM-08-1]|uniref:Uncharacterized protein n=1 Tax=Laccaria amethystina LaAM-08-1 TaxID=1095629 RepID=A0A0C9XWQ7_9AGAR|nr:hypothetical protein K443DRAFT_3526 [Laccaria amethystina LaAM-08-1]
MSSISNPPAETAPTTTAPTTNPSSSAFLPCLQFISLPTLTNTAPLSPEAQAIKDGFDRIGAIGDPRAGMGRIPRPPSDSDSDTPPPPRPMGMGLGRVPGDNVEKDSETPLSPEAQAIADGFKRILGGQPDSRMGYGRIPRQSEPE